MAWPGRATRPPLPGQRRKLRRDEYTVANSKGQPLKLLIDISEAVAGGIVSPAQGEQLRRRAAVDTFALAINVLLSLGVIGVCAGVLTLRPANGSVIGLGLVVAFLGFAINKIAAARWGLPGTACVLTGVILVSVGVLEDWQANWQAYLGVAAILLLFAALARNRLLAALSVVALCASIGGSSGYSHAVYWVWIREPLLTVLLFAALALASEMVSVSLPAGYRPLATTIARLSVLFVNFGFWIGSLWGDYPLAHWRVPEFAYDSSASWQSGYWLHISPAQFAIAWAVALVAVGAWGAARNRRYVVNIVAVFGSIHFYTQFFERLDHSPSMLILAGCIAIGIAVALWRYNEVRLAP